VVGISIDIAFLPAPEHPAWYYLYFAEDVLEVGGRRVHLFKKLFKINHPVDSGGQSLSA
jgi:hypothetical protein